MKKVVACFLALAALIPGVALAQMAEDAQLQRITVKAEALDENRAVGPNAQPEWTTQRRFPTTRVYVLAPGQVEFEQWWKGKFPRSGNGSAEHLFQEEIGLGLPGRFQLDLYENITADDHGRFRHDGNQVELRYALADWGRIPFNPTLYGEWKANANEADAYEIKLLLGDSLGARWHWGTNLFFEQQTGGARQTEWGFSNAISYTILDEKLSAGIEMNFENTTVRGSRRDAAVEFLIGPSIQWRPTHNTHLDFVPLVGTTHDAPGVEAFIVFGLDFGHEEKSGVAPVSVRAR